MKSSLCLRVSKRRRPITLFAACLALLLALRITDAASTSSPFGVKEDLAWAPPADVDLIIDRMVNAGVRIVRLDFRWYMFEPSNGVWTFQVHDPIVQKLRARGIEILGLLSTPPLWATGGDVTKPPINDADWRDFVVHVADRYKGQVVGWEIWNEENLDVYFKPPNPARYVSMLKTAFQAIRGSDPAATVVLGGLGGNGVYMGWEFPESQNFLQKIYDNGGKGYFDVVAIHPYVHPLLAGVDAFRRFVADTHTVMAANGEANKPLWLTEMGWSTSPNAYGQPTITETDAANWVQSVYAAQPSLGVERIFWCCFRDVGTDPLNVEHHFGLLNYDESPKPGYFRYAALATPWFTKSTPTHGITRPLAPVTLGWTSSPGATGYDYCLAAGSSGGCNGPWTDVGNGSSITVAGLSRNTTWRWQIRARNGTAPVEGNNGEWWSFRTTDAFTDDPLIPADAVRGAHVSELRARIDALRLAHGLQPFGWADPVLAPGTILVRALHVNQMRNALRDAYSAARVAAPIFTDPVLVAGSALIKRVHITELRQAVKDLESAAP